MPRWLNRPRGFFWLHSELVRHRFSVSVQGRLKKPVRPELLSFKGEKLDQALAGAIDAALDRSNRNVADAGGLIVGEPLRPDQEKRLALVMRQLRQSDAEVGRIKPGALLR